VIFLLCAFKGSLQTLLDYLFATLDNGLLRTVSKKRRFPSPAKTQSPTAFEALNYNLVGLLNELLPEPRWQGLRLVATDSITLFLPPWLENQAEFGVQTDIAGQLYVLAHTLGVVPLRLEAYAQNRDWPFR
jgi:hypothetical protein